MGVATVGRDPRVVAARARRLQPQRLPLLAMGMVALAGAAWGGLLRLGWTLPVASASLAVFHGPLMVAGFLGTVIGLERAVALRAPWAFAAPLASGVGVVTLIALGAGGPGPWLMTAASAVVVVIFAVLLARQRALFVWIMALGALAWLVAQALWLAGWPIYRVVPWWVAFLTFTIAGERLELTRLLAASRASRIAFLAIIVTILGGLVIAVGLPDSGVRVFGIGLLALAAWLSREDIARRTVRLTGVTRFIAVALLSGYAWLAVGGALAIIHGDVAAGPVYDAVLHAIFVGFVFSMIFGHAPVIFPAVLGPAVTYRPAFYVHLALLHASLLVRVAGDVVGSVHLRQCGGLGNALAILLFLANTVYGILKPRAQR